MEYAVKNKATGNYFAGFDADGSALWAECSVWTGTFEAAKAQASLLVLFDKSVQRKPCLVQMA